MYDVFKCRFKNTFKQYSTLLPDNVGYSLRPVQATAVSREVKHGNKNYDRHKSHCIVEIKSLTHPYNQPANQPPTSPSTLTTVRYYFIPITAFVR